LAAWPFVSPDESSPPAAPQAQGYLPPDADPYYSTPGGFDSDVDMKLSTRRFVADPTGKAPGTLTVDTAQRKLFLSLSDGRAIEYRKAFWPGWTPPPEMLARQPELPAHTDGGLGNPLGARALYLFQDNKDTLFRIHGTNDPKSIGKAVSSGCIRMLNSDVIDLFQRVGKGTPVVVL
jgi:lipoprotein-anchoring transpeptidase ErfK/SrfK